MSQKQKMIIAAVAVVIAGGLVYFTVFRDSGNVKNSKQIQLNQEEQASQSPRNEGPVSPISGIACENWNKRPIAAMQPSDVQARPAAGFSEADMVIEMPAFTGSVTRLLGVYLCNIPKEIGALRSARHDYIHLAKSLDAVFVHWGGSIFAYNKLATKVIDSMDCMTSSYCERWPVSGKMRVEDTGHITKENVLKMMDDRGYKQEGSFSGYPHQEELSLDQRPKGGHLRVAFKKPYDVEYDYDRETNSYLRTWGEAIDTDRNNEERLRPKNVVVMMAASEQITLDQNYTGKGLEDPWAEIPEIKRTGSETIDGRYNNMQLGDPWYDEAGGGDAYFYLNGAEIKGTWKKDRAKIDSKLFFYDSSGQEIKFVPGQIWIEILEPGQALRWELAI